MLPLSSDPIVGVAGMMLDAWKGMGTVLLYLGGLAATVYVVAGLALYFMQPRLLYRPTRDVASTPVERDLDFEDVLFKSTDGVALHGWYVPAPKAPFTVLFCHGNGGNISHRLDSVELFHSLGLSCFAFDYRGYGRSEGRPTEEGTYRDAQAAYDWLTQTRQVPVEQIVLLGRSLGGSVAAHLAGRVTARGLVIESAFTSYPDIGARFYPYMPVRRLARYQYDTMAHLVKVRCPVMVMHSPDDRLVPFEFGRQLFEAAPEPKQFVRLAGDHNDGFLVSGASYTEAWTRWLNLPADGRHEGAVHEAS